MPLHMEFDENWLNDYCKRTGQANPLAGSSDKKPAKRNKYNNKPTERDGIRFDSIHEADKWSELQMMLRAGEILGVFRQHPFKLPGGVVYRADFVVLNRDGTFSVMDAKSVATEKDKTYRNKRKQMRECLGIEIVEV